MNYLLMLIVCISLTIVEDHAVAREAGEGGPDKKAGEGGPAEQTSGPAEKAGAADKPSSGLVIDRLAWLAGLIEQLKNQPRPACEGPRGCSMSIPADSPCMRPVKSRPEVIIDGVLPGVLPNTWAVAYRRVCSDCYLGGAGTLALVRLGKGNTVGILDSLALKKTTDAEIPTPLEMISEDVDDDNRLEMVIRYRNERERKQKCTGLEDAAAFLLVARVDGNRLVEVAHAPLDFHPVDKGRPYTTAYRFEDENEDGYPDLILSRTDTPDIACAAKGAKCDVRGEKGIRTTESVHRYREDTGDWSEPPFSGYALEAGDTIHCAVPLPETPFAVIAQTLPGKTLTDAMEAKSRALRDAGYLRTCLYNGADYSGLKPDHFYVITSTHAGRGTADDAAFALRKAGFRPFVKELFR